MGKCHSAMILCGNSLARMATHASSMTQVMQGGRPARRLNRLRPLTTPMVPFRASWHTRVEAATKPAGLVGAAQP